MTNEIIANKRNRTGKGSSRFSRLQNKIPAILYGDKIEPIALEVDPKNINNYIHDSSFYNNIYNLNIDNSKTEEVLVREVQFDPIKPTPIHLNFLRVSKNTLVDIEVPVIFLNQAKSMGIKLGGVLNIITHHVALRCNPKNAPKSIEIDLADARIGSVFKIEDIKLDKSVKHFYPEGFAIASITASAKADDKAGEVAAGK